MSAKNFGENDGFTWDEDSDCSIKENYDRKDGKREFLVPYCLIHLDVGPGKDGIEVETVCRFVCARLNSVPCGSKCRICGKDVFLPIMEDIEKVGVAVIMQAVNPDYEVVLAEFFVGQELQPDTENWNSVVQDANKRFAKEPYLLLPVEGYIGCPEHLFDIFPLEDWEDPNDFLSDF